MKEMVYLILFIADYFCLLMYSEGLDIIFQSVSCRDFCATCVTKRNCKNMTVSEQASQLLLLLFFFAVYKP